MGAVHAGYYVAGRGLGETEDEWAEIVAKVKLDLPPQKPLFVCGVGGPRNIITNIKLGFDVLETRSAPTHAVELYLLVYCAFYARNVQLLLSVGTAIDWCPPMHQVFVDPFYYCCFPVVEANN